MSHPIASKGHIQICAVGSPGFAPASQKSFNFGTGGLDKWPNDDARKSGAIETSPSVPAPRIKCRKNVSMRSSRLCASATLVKP